MLSLIFARSLNHCIGVEGRIPWRLPDDFKHFKQTTMAKPIIMGRKTYEDHSSALPGRMNIVVTRQKDYSAAEGVYVVESLDAAKELAYKESQEIFVIGGVSFFEQAFEQADKVYETIVEAHIEGDTFLPEFNYDNWHTRLMSHHDADSRHEYAFSIFEHQRS
jgi:dihydrofolate reductase